MPYKKSYRRRPYGRPASKKGKVIGKVRGRRAVLPTKGFATAVKKVIHRMAENKVQVVYGTNAAINRANGAGSVFGNLNLLPVLSNGTNENQRIGNEVRIVKSYIDFYVNLLPYNAINNPAYPLTCKVWIASKKNQNRETSTLSAGDCDSFFEAGGAGLPPQGNMLDMIFPVNKDAWTLHTMRQFELAVPTGSTTYPVSSSLATPTNEGRFQVHYKIPLTKYFKKLKYDTTNYPTNHNLWFMIQTVNSDGSTQVLSGAEMHFATTWYYEDL